MDTVTLANQEQEKQGPRGQVDVSYEGEADLHKQLNIFVKNPSPQKCIPADQINYGGEADLHKHFNDCAKKPRDQKFVPVDQFNVNHLPPGCRDNDLVNYVQALSDLTVRVSVKYVSDRRPETVPGSDKPYPRYMGRDRNMMRTGTGWVCGVDKYINERDSPRTCNCQECLDSPTPKTQFADIYMQTSAHVVYDELEAAHTTCHLFFDKGGSPRDCSGVLELSGWAFDERGEEGDWCHMVHVTHDLDLADRLDKMVVRRVNLWEKVNNKYQGLESGEQESSSSSEHLPEVLDNLAIIVSHPHGCSKQISVGDWTGRDEREGGPAWTSYSYPTLTCLGSSGAPVFMLGDRWVNLREKVVNKNRGLASGEQESSSPSEHLPEVLDNLTIKVSRPDGSNKQVQTHGAPSTIVTNPDVPQSVTKPDLVANSQNMGKVDEEKKCLSNLLSVVTEPRENQKKAESTYQIEADKPPESESFLLSLTDETETKSREEKPDLIHRQQGNEQHFKVQTHGEHTTNVTNQDVPQFVTKPDLVANQAISQFVTTPDLVANSQNMDKVKEEKECLSNLLSVETEPSENLKKAESTYQINADKLPESESFLSSLNDETATKSRESQPDWMHRATKIIIVLNCILCLATVITTVALVILGGGNKGEKQLPQEICVQCSKLLSNTAHSIKADPLLNKLTKRLDNGLQMCCAQDEGQMSAMWEVAARKRTSSRAPKPHEMVANPRCFPVSVKKQLLPVDDSELNRTDLSLSYDSLHFVMRFSTDYHDPLTEHVRGVKVLDSAMEINYTGLYYVYMNIFIHVKSPQPPRSLLFQNWYQDVHHTRPGDPNSDHRILQTAHTTLMENINDQATTFAGGTFYLKKGDLIEVHVNGLGLLDYKKEFTFLGLFMLENGEMKQEMFF